MLADVQQAYGLARPFHGAGNFETEHQRMLVREVCSAVQTGRLVVVSGLVGSGKTHLLRRIEDELRRADRVTVTKSLSAEKRRITLTALIEAMFYDLTPGGRTKVKVPKGTEGRERDLQALAAKRKRPVVLIVDEAHDLHHKTLTGLKRIMEIVADGGVPMSVLLVGHPRLRNDLRRPQMEGIGYRTTIFDYEGIGAEQRRDYVAWLLGVSAAEGIKVADLMDEGAIELLAERLRTPLQIEMHLTLAFEHAYRLDTKPVSADIVEQVLSRAIDDLEPTLTRNGYDAAAIAQQFNAKPSEVKAFLAGTLDPDRGRELTEKLRQAGVPV